MVEEREIGDESMSQRVLIEIEMPTDLDKFSLPTGVNERLQFLLDRQEQGEHLTPAERMEAEGLVNLAELISLLRLRAQRALTVHEVTAERSEVLHELSLERSELEGNNRQ